ncbi:MAG TPA: type II toxin-antitoxin system RelE/ParE family toxin [Candidatus Gastranaerophilaceae bacterium]|nr:type II toxin-antitoxin system RelE/ParE family toxin [Candidatus Gastranaerophilaceae bacterium]HPT41292.1 type II toxin-antitoxin system RelE/ParE family toxin [Candidatus Gastranaerophilaceae bacterium]
MDKRKVLYLKLNRKEPLKDWLKSLDKIVAKRILQRLIRIEEGNLGDFKKIDDEISELRFMFGPGYRIYYTEINNVILLLINGGNKSTQSKDIVKAKELLEQWRQEND